MKETKMLIYSGYVFILDRYIYESDEMFYFRINYIYKNINFYKNKFDILVGLSKIESEKYFNNCDY